jgi:hypothetical protein
MLESVAPTDQDETIPEHFPLAVIMRCRPVLDNTWIDSSWEAVGVAIGEHAHSASDGPLLIHEEDGVSEFLYSGLGVNLYLDQCESYYHNLMSPNPGCYIVARIEDDDNTPVPFLVSLSFDEAHAYLEGDAEVFTIPIPPELYRWTEAYVIANYVAVKRKKRKLQNWKQQDGGNTHS